jgi:hypothetical protein
MPTGARLDPIWRTLCPWLKSSIWRTGSASSWTMRARSREKAEGALRYSVDARIDGRIFEQMSLDVNVIDPRDARPIELVVVQRNPFEFVGETLLEIPMVTPEQQVIADQVQLPSGARLTDARTHSKCGLPGGRPSSSSHHPTGSEPAAAPAGS